MSVLSRYAARCERVTSALRNESPDLLNDFDTLAPGEGFPISGDMLSVIKHASSAKRTQRLARVRRSEGETGL